MEAPSRNDMIRCPGRPGLMLVHRRLPRPPCRRGPWLRPPVLPDGDVGVDERDLGVGVEQVRGGAQRAGLVPAVVLGERDVGGVDRGHAGVAPGRARVRGQAHHVDARDPLGDLRCAVGRRVVDDDDARALGQAREVLERAGDAPGAVVHDDDDGHAGVGRRGGAVHAPRIPGWARGTASMPSTGQFDVAGRRLTIRNLDRVVFPRAGTTKADILAYYMRVADTILEHLRGRPLHMHRYPEGGRRPAVLAEGLPGAPAGLGRRPRRSGAATRRTDDRLLRRRGARDACCGR